MGGNRQHVSWIISPTVMENSGSTRDPQFLDTSSMEAVETFVKRAFPAKSLERKVLDDLCKMGCERTMLQGWLFSISEFVAGGTHKHSPWSLLLGISESDLIKLPKTVNLLADEIERANRSQVVNPAFGILKALGRVPADKRKYYRRLATAFQSLPALLRQYADHVKNYSRQQRRYFGPKIFKTLPFLLVQFLDDVEDSMGTPHYQDVGQLLETAYVCAAGSYDAEDRILKSFSSEALTKLHQRGDKYRFRFNPVREYMNQVREGELPSLGLLDGILCGPRKKRLQPPTKQA